MVYGHASHLIKSGRGALSAGQARSRNRPVSSDKKPAGCRSDAPPCAACWGQNDEEIPKDPVREDRIYNEAIVDARPEEQLLMESVANLTPQTAQVIARQRIELQPAGGGYAPQRE